MKFWLLFILYWVIMFCNIQIATLFTIEIYNLSEAQGGTGITNWICAVSFMIMYMFFSSLYIHRTFNGLFDELLEEDKMKEVEMNENR